MEVKGHNGTIQVLENKVIIKRTGILSFISQGLKGDKEIYIDKISSIQIKKANWLTNGYIQFGFLGGQESKGGVLDATSDENTVMFTSGQQENFLKLKSFLEEKMQVLKTSNNDYELKLAQKMKKYIDEGKEILEAQALAKMEIALEK